MSAALEGPHPLTGTGEAPDLSRPAPVPAVAGAAFAAAAALLAGCATSPGIPAGAGLDANLPPPTPARASRFLQQAAFAATPEQLQRVQALGYAGWLDEQMQMPRTQGHVDWMLEKGYGEERYRNNFQGVDNTLWRKLIGSPDVLRQRVALALSEIFVISMQGLPGPWRGLMAAHYMDLLETHAFGHYRQLLEAVTLSTPMGLYLNMRGNRKGDAATGRMPDENYAREVLQLFSIGLVMLNEDGTPMRDAQGRPIDTYDQDTVSGLARVFTGWVYDGFDRQKHDWVLRPMTLVPAQHEGGEKRFLGHRVPAGMPGREALRRTLDAIAAHPNVGPFIGRQLIQRLVCSNPSPAYVKRVARAFHDNGQGVRGDMAAVVRAVLLDEEAHRDPRGTDMAAGRLREPMVRFIQWGRTFGASSGNGQWAIGSTENPANRLGQSPLRSPSVFNFFRPGYVPPNSTLARQGLPAPEFQLVHETSVVAWINFAQQFVAAGVADVKPDYAAELAKADDPQALVDHLNLMLAADGLGETTRSLIAKAIATLPVATPNGRRARVQAAIHLVLCSPEYLVAA